MIKKKRIAVLGATGSIGKSALDIISRDTGNFEVVLLTAHSNRQKLDELSKQFPSANCVLTEDTRQLNRNEKLISVIKNAKADITVNGISGAAGLQPSLAAIESGSHLALANKETIVMAGQLVMNLAKEKNVSIIPVDSEHSAIFHLLKSFNNSSRITSLSEIILTASGGPFRNKSLQEMENVTVKDALAHPTWNMGPKITIDSASMANKGLEIIEACVFFNIPSDKIKVVIHPQSIVHSMIRLCNGVVYAQLSKPDMRHPIHDALYWPVTTPLDLDLLNFDSLTLEFSKPDTGKFPMLINAWVAADKGGLYPCAYNAANEIAVSAFLEHKIKFTDIPKVTEHVLQSDWSSNHLDIEAILEADKTARLKAVSFL
ncbi:MAG: 1-deoxy-D-xylulose-5-phosphate reductoisomerase [Treponema sp.]|nr:1-deoxy-D-xylulose-5-phosphate reductoisomerase [Treponema sp.]